MEERLLYGLRFRVSAIARTIQRVNPSISTTMEQDPKHNPFDSYTHWR